MEQSAVLSRHIKDRWKEFHRVSVTSTLEALLWVFYNPVESGTLEWDQSGKVSHGTFVVRQN